MKRLIFFLLPVIFLSSCSDFYHLHYKKLDKIPAKGFVAPLELKEKRFSDRKKITAAISDSLKKNVLDSDRSEKKSSELIPLTKKRNQNFSVSKKVQKKSGEKIAEKNKSIFPAKKDHKKFDGAIFFVILLLVLSLSLIVGGGIVFVIGIYAAFWLPIVGGLLMFLLGLFPVLGFIGLMMGDRYHPVENYEDKEKKMNP